MKKKMPKRKKLSQQEKLNNLMHYTRKIWHWFFPNDSFADKILDKLRFGKYKKA